MDTDGLAALAAEAGFGEIGAPLAALARPSLRLEAVADEERIGASRLGGIPDLPATVDWPAPAWREEPMSFIAQIALGELDAEVWPGPHDGLLSVFCALSAEHGGVDHPGSALVLHIPADATVEPRESPAGLAPELALRQLPVEARLELTLPGIGSDVSAALLDLGFGWDGDRVDQQEDYIEFQHRVAEAQGFARHTPDGRWASQHRLLGWARPVQGDVLDDLAFMSLEANGAPYDRTEIPVRARAFRLLLQVDADPRLGVDFGDGGSLYFGLLADELARGRFDATEAVVQSG